MTFLLYIDPGTGSMLFSLFIGLATALVFGTKTLFVKLKFLFSGGKNNSSSKTSTTIPFVIFAEDKRYWNVFHLICDEFEHRKIPVLYYTCSEDDTVFLQNYSFVQPLFIGEGNKAFAKLNFLNADTVISTTPGLDVFQWKRSKNVRKYVHIPHAVDDLSSYRMFGLDHYDIILANGYHQPKCLHKLEEIRHQNPKEIPVVGCPYMDHLKNIYDNSPKREPNKKTIVLVAPSWGPNSIFTKFGEKFLDALTNTDFDIIIRPHPQSIISEKEMINSFRNKYTKFEWNFDADNFSVLNKSDILISDFSGIICDFAFIFDRPIIYANTEYDKSQYDADWLDEEMWALKILPDLGRKLEEKEFCNLKTIINDVLTNQELKESRQRVIDEAWQFKGQSAKKIVDYLIKNNELIK